MNAIADEHPHRDPDPAVGRRPADGGRGDPGRPVGRAPGKFGNAVRLSGRRPERDAAGRHRRPASTTSRSPPGSTWRHHDLVAGLRLRHRHDAKHVPDGQRRAPARASRSPPPAAAPSSASTRTRRAAAAQPVDPPRGHAVRQHRHALRQRRRGRQQPEHHAATVDMGNTTQNWIGKSQYGDPGLNGDRSTTSRSTTARSAAEEIPALATAPGAGNVASLQVRRGRRRDRARLLRQRPRNATRQHPVFRHPGKVFKQRNVARNALVPWKDQQNFSPFTEGVVPNTDDYKQALRYYADRRSSRSCRSTRPTSATRPRRRPAGGRNNFSNINSTLQAQLYAKALREYPSHVHHPGHVPPAARVAHLGAVRQRRQPLPGQQRVLLQLGPDDQTLGRSGIHHNILGAYNFMIIDDIAGLRPRLDDTVELWPIDVGWDHFAVNNLSYHGADMTVVWDRPATAARTTPACPRAIRSTSTAGACSPSTTSPT